MSTLPSIDQSPITSPPGEKGVTFGKDKFLSNINEVDKGIIHNSAKQSDIDGGTQMTPHYQGGSDIHQVHIRSSINDVVTQLIPSDNQSINFKSRVESLELVSPLPHVLLGL